MHITNFRRHNPPIFVPAGHAVLANFDIVITEGVVKDAALARYAGNGTLAIWSPRGRVTGPPSIIFAPSARAILLEEAEYLYETTAPQLEAA